MSKHDEPNLETLGLVMNVACWAVICGYIGYWLTHLVAAAVKGSFNVP